MASVGSAVLGLLVLGAVFWPLEHWRAALPEQPRRRCDLRTDVAYWFVSSLVTRLVSDTAVVITVFVVALAIGVPPTAQSMQRYFDDPTQLVRSQPMWLQAFEALFVADLAGYWIHRLFHGGTLWKFHAVHHSSTHVDWLSSVRLHPVNDALMRIPQALLILALGFPPTVLVAYLPAVVIYGIFLHANVPWDFGPLRHVMASPAFHRWHHTSLAEGRDRNFAGIFPIIDIVFGTFHLPRGRQPSAFGVGGEAVPRGIWAQMLYPFRRTQIVAEGTPRP